MLDGWRGLAALTVVCYHLFNFPGGNQAVILFFVISGYCIAAASCSARQKQLGFGLFMWRRIRRIYPPYLLSIAYFVGVHLTRAAKGDGPQFARFGAVAWLQNLTLTQWMSLVRHPLPLAPANPINMVAAFWSLGYEEQFYLVVAILIALSFLSGRLVSATLALLAVFAVAWNLYRPQLEYGFFIEYWVNFGVGALVFFRLCRARTPAVRRGIDTLFVLIGLVGLWRLQSGADLGAERSIGMEWTVVAGFALLLIAARKYDTIFQRLAIGRLLIALGFISYSLYLTHQTSEPFLWRVASYIWPYGGRVPMHQFTIIHGGVQIALHLLAATGFWYCCERPFLNRGSAARQPVAPTIDHAMANDFAPPAYPELSGSPA